MLTTADVAARAGVPLGSLYEYFEDLPAIVDAAVARVLDRHDELLRDVLARPPRSVAQLVDVLFESYRRLYVEEYGFLALRNSTLFERRHREWLTDCVAAFVRKLGEQGVASGALAGRADLVERLDLLFALGDAVLQAGLRGGPPGDPAVFEEGRALLRYAARRVARTEG